VFYSVNNQIEAEKMQLELVFFALLISLIIFVFSIYILAIVHFNKNKRVIFAKTTHGLAFYKINGKFLIQTSIVPLLAVSGAYFVFGAPFGHVLLIVLALVLVSSSSAALSAVVLTRRLLRNYQQL
jgi:hypothetical protein